MSENPTTLQIENGQAKHEGVRTIWLNRPDVRNAMNDVLIAELNQAIDAAMSDDSVRVIVLAGRGKAFCSGADLAWMKSGKQMSPDQSAQDTGALARAMRSLYEGVKPSVARVHGSAFAGALGLVTACDIAVASEETRFSLSEVKLGLIPAMISPYVTKAVGEANARRLTLTAEVFQAPFAARIGLIHESVPVDALDQQLDHFVSHLLAAGPKALAEGKRLIRDIAQRPIDDEITRDTAERIARVRASDEGQEGIAAFFEKRAPSWVKGG